MMLKGKTRGVAGAVLAVVAVVLCFTIAASGGPEALLSTANPRVQEVMAVQNAITKDLMAQPEILGTAVGQDTDGGVVLMIFVNSEARNHGEVMRALPRTLKGKRVKGLLTPPFRAYGKPGSGAGVSHTAMQAEPIQLGTSGGWGEDLANGFCCGGTLGCLIDIGGRRFILSNYHVLQSDIVPGGNGIVAGTGDAVIHPGLIDAGCAAEQARVVATLSGIASLPNSNVDAAVAEVLPNMVDPAGAILEVGVISSSTVPAYVGQSVKKSGRTTGLTRSRVSAVNATISVEYAGECGGKPVFAKVFTGQIIVSNTRNRFLNGGDSGSLLVEDANTLPRAVGLLFAGSNTMAVANPIDEVLAYFGARMVGR
jgi:hypothetical protein